PALLCAAVTAAQDSRPEFRAAVRVVNVPCTVRDRQGNYVSNLTKDDFTVREDGVEQKVSYFAAPGEDRLSITLLLDTDPPILDYLRTEKNAAIEFFKRPLGSSESAALTRFDHEFRIVEDFTESAERLRTAAEKLPEHGAAADATLEKRTTFKGVGGSGVIQTGRNAELYEATCLAAHHMQDRKGRKALIVVSDWSDLGTRLGLESVLEAAEESSTILYPVRLTEHVTIAWAGRREAATDDMLRKLAEETGGRNLDVDADHPLEALLEQIRQELRAQYLLGYTPLGTARANAYRRIEVAVDTAGLEVRARAGYDSGTKPAQAAEQTARFSTTGTAEALPPKPPRTLENFTVQTPPRPACTLFSTSAPRTGLLGGMESLLPFTEKGAEGPEDAEAARIVAQVAETYRRAQSIDLRGVWETEQKGRFAGREFDRMDMRFLSERSKATFSLTMERPGAVWLNLDATWTRQPGNTAEPFASQYRFVTDCSSEWMYWPASGVYSRSAVSGWAREAFAAVLERYAYPANYPADLRVVRRATDASPYVVLRGRGPVAGLTHEYWVEEKHHLVIFERIGDWAGHLTASLTWKEQRLNFTVERESFVFAPPPGAIQAADPLGIPEPRCEAAFPFTALPSETTPADFTLPDQAGQAVRFAELKGTPMLLTFWHTWSPLAAAQLRELEQFQKQRGARGVVVLGYTDEPPEVVRAFLQKNGLTLRTMIDRDHSATWLYPRTPGWREMRYEPTTVVVSRDGKSATAWPGGLSMEGLQQAMRVSGK
ncbi:MAG: VWA domain-containing protein, partial [Bryobacteraceae bacterium]